MNNSFLVWARSHPLEAPKDTTSEISTKFEIPSSSTNGNLNEALDESLDDEDVRIEIISSESETMDIHSFDDLFG